MQPVAVVGQIEHAGAAGDRAAVPDRGQKVAFFQWVNDLRPGFGELLPQVADLVDEPREPRRVDAGLAAVTAQDLGVALELLADVRAHVAAPQDRQDLEQRGDRGAGAELGRLVDVEQRLLVEELHAQERPHALRERLLERHERVLG